jgi:serine/threonine protein kinase
VSQAPFYHNALPLDSTLLEYRLKSVLGAGGFGITYLGWDTNLEKHVAIKEYLPGDLAMRALDGSVVPVSTDNEYTYQWGLDRFIQEARTLARFSHPNIVRVNRFFEANGTSYMVMDYEAGESLHQNLRRMPIPDEATLKGILIPILDGLQAVHKVGFLHRDIKPSNVFMRENGSALLLDFGAARMATDDATKSKTAIVTPGYAPLEQYSKDGNQGPWSDIYGLAAVMYRAITGENPSDAIKRMKSDNVSQMLADARERYAERFLRAVEWGMALDEGLRPQTVADWRDAISGRAALSAFNRGVASMSPASAARGVPDAITVRVPKIHQREAIPAAAQPKRISESRAYGKLGWMIGGGVVVTVLGFAAGYWENHHTGEIAPSTITAGRLAASSEVPVVSQNAPPEVPVPAAVPAPPMELRREPADRPSVAISAPLQSTTPAENVQGTRDLIAETPRMKPPTGNNTENLKSVMARKEFVLADRDGDGYLSRDEIRGRFPFIEQNFQEVDTDRDGRISPDELIRLRIRQQATLKSF